MMHGCNAPYVPLCACRLTIVIQEANANWRRWALGAAATGLGMISAYVSIIFGAEDNNSLAEVLPWIVAMAIPPLAAVISVLVKDRNFAKVLLIGSTVAFLMLGYVSIFSIGVGFLAAGGMAGTGALRMSAPDEG